MAPVSYGRSNRLWELNITGSAGVKKLRGSAIRNVLGLKDSLFAIERADLPTRPGQPAERVFTFKGRGWGHGVGMCQVGAYGLAKEGYSHSQILKKYYRDINLKRLY
jgi:stage II sporulation protein D